MDVRLATTRRTTLSFRVKEYLDNLSKAISPRMIANRQNGLSEPSYRADIDGLRAIAVLAVVAFHANPNLAPGGFVGVDVFFVISGFLISQLILSGLRSGSFSFVDFYERRIRRLFPALIVVLLTVWGLGWFLMLPSDFAALGSYVLAGSTFMANILTYSQIGYFDGPASSKPLLHLWSLGVEEQFYIVFPAMLTLAWRAGVVRWSLALLGIASFAANIVLVSNHPSFCFYLPMTRFWEFAAGALLAYARVQRPALGWRVSTGLLTPARRNVSAVIGLLLIIVAVMITRSASFPGWWAVLPVVGVFLVIEAGQEAWLNRKVLANRTLVAVGLFSYPLYLWHWPLLLIAHANMPSISPNSLHDTLTTIAVVALAFVLSWLTYRFIERPVRARRPSVLARRFTIASFTCAALVALLGLATVESAGIPFRYPPAVQALLTPLTYGMDFPVAKDSKNKAGPLVVMYGDSHAGHLLAGLYLLQNERTFQLKLIGWPADCAAVGAAWGVAPKPGDEEKCRAITTANEKLFAELKPDIVVLGAFWRQYDHIERLGATLQFFQRIGVRRIVIIGTVPFWPEPPQTLLFRTYQADPQHRVPERLFGFDKQTLEFDQRLKEIASSFGVVYISAYDTLCNENGCLVRLGDAAKDIVQVDLTHFSAAGSWFFVSHVAHQIFGCIIVTGCTSEH